MFLSSNRRFSSNQFPMTWDTGESRITKSWHSFLWAIFAAAFGIAFTSVCVADSNSRTRTLVKSGSKWEQKAGYSRAVVDGNWVFVSGTVGADRETGAIPKQFDAQMDQIFANIVWALEQGGAVLNDIVVVHCFLVDAKYLDAMSVKLREYLGATEPTNTTIITQLAANDALIEIEVIALKRSE